MIARRLRDKQVRGEPITIRKFVVNFSVQMQMTKTLLPPSKSSFFETPEASEPTPRCVFSGVNSRIPFSFVVLSSVFVPVERIITDVYTVRIYTT